MPAPANPNGKPVEEEPSCSHPRQSFGSAAAQAQEWNVICRHAQPAHLCVAQGNASDGKPQNHQKSMAKTAQWYG